MDLRELLAFISRENQRLQDRHTDLDENIAPLVQTIKLNEEVGELCDAVLAYDSFQRSEKLDEFEEQDLDDELADVLITSLLLADMMDVDVEEALENKIETVEKRHE